MSMIDPDRPFRGARTFAPISEEELEQLAPLLIGVLDAAARLKNVLPDTPQELDGSTLSRTVEGEK